MICKLTALLEYLNLLQNFHERNFCMILAYKFFFTAKIKQIMVCWSSTQDIEHTSNYTNNHAGKGGYMLIAFKLTYTLKRVTNSRFLGKLDCVSPL